MPIDCENYLIASNVSLIDSCGNLLIRNRLKDSLFYNDNFLYVGTTSILANPFPGMSMMISRKTAKNYIDFQNNGIMHDWNIFIITILTRGSLFFIRESLVLYRQHSSNYIGSSSSINLTKRLVLVKSHYSSLLNQFNYFKSNLILNIVSAQYLFKRNHTLFFFIKISKLYFLTFDYFWVTFLFKKPI